MIRPTIPLVCFCIVLAGCDSGAMQSESSVVLLQLSSVAEAFADKPIPVGPAIQQGSDRAVVLSADVQARQQPVAVKRFVVAFRSTANISKIISDAQLQVSDKKYKLSRIDSTRRGRSGFFVFAASDKLFTATTDSRRLQIAVNPKSSASGEQLQLSIRSKALRRIQAIVSVGGRQLSTDNIVGTILANRSAFKRAGPHVDLVAATSENLTDGVSITMRLEVSAFAVDVAIPWRPRFLDTAGKRRQPGGVFFAVTDSSGQPLTSDVRNATLEITRAVASNQQLSATNQLMLPEGQGQRFAISVQVCSENSSEGACLRAAKISFRSKSSGQLHTTQNTLNIECTDF